MLKSLITTLVFFAFIMAGANKITEVHPETHKFLSDGFKTFGPIWEKVFKDAGKTVGQESLAADLADKYLLDDGSKTYQKMMKIIGYSEAISALALVTPLRTIGLLVLAINMSGAVYTHIQIGDSPMPPAVLLGLVITLLFWPGPPKGKAGKKSKSS